MTESRQAHAKPGRVLGALVNYGAGSYLPQIINFLLVPLYTRYIDPREMGILEIALSTQALLTILMRVGLPGSVTRLYHDAEHPGQLRDLVTTVAISIVGMSLGVGVLMFLVGPLVFERAMGDVPFWPYIALAIAAAILGSAPDLQRRLMQAREESAASARLSIAFGFLSTVTTLVLVIGFELGALGILWASIGVGALFAGVAWWRQRDDLRGRFDASHFRASVTYGLPLVPHHVGAWAQQNIGRFFLSAVVDSASVGLLSIATRIASPLGVATGAFSMAYSPVYFAWRKNLSPAEAERESKRVGAAVAVLGATAVLGAATLGVWVTRHVLHETYREGAALVGIVAVALYLHLLYSLVAVEIVFSKRTQWMSIIFIVSAAINAAFVWLLAVRWGAVGAAISQALGGVASVVLVCVIARRSFAVPLQPRSLGAAVAVTVAASLLPFWQPALSPLAELVLQVGILTICAALMIALSGISGELIADVTAIGARMVRRLKGPT